MRNQLSKRPIICFIGLDGSGKSTCVEYAYKMLKAQGLPVEIVRAAYVLNFMTVFVKAGKRILLRKDHDPFESDYRQYLMRMREHAKKGFVYKVFSFLTTLEFRLQIWINIRLKQRMGKVLLVDRYIYDNAVTLSANLDGGITFVHQEIHGKWRAAPKPDMIIYIKTPADVCYSRKDDIPDIYYLTIREPLYDAISVLCNARVISGEQTKEAMLAEVAEYIQSMLGTGDMTK